MNLQSFVPVPADSHFPIHNLPFGVFSTAFDTAPRIGVRIGDLVLDLAMLDSLAYFGYHVGGKGVFSAPALNPLMALGRDAWREARAVATNLLRAGNPTLQDPDVRRRVLHPLETVTMHLPASIGDYTDFYASREHATNLGTMFRGPENALPPNWLHLPIGYHGRASSVILSGIDFHRPSGQTAPPGTSAPVFGPSQQLDLELEMGCFVGPGNELGRPMPIAEAEGHIFGLVLLNDWSARDIQRWEYQPLGPFLGKNFATSISPWVVSLEALAPFRTSGPRQDPAPLPYLAEEQPAAYDIRLEVTLQTDSMGEPHTISRSNLKHMYWSITQQLAHHASGGCNLRPGDLLGTGTISGPDPDSLGSLIELSWRGERPLRLPNGETRTFLEDGDRITLSAYCQGDGYRVGFGEVTARVLPAV